MKANLPPQKCWWTRGGQHLRGAGTSPTVPPCFNSEAVRGYFGASSWTLPQSWRTTSGTSTGRDACSHQRGGGHHKLWRGRGAICYRHPVTPPSVARSGQKVNPASCITCSLRWRRPLAIWIRSHDQGLQHQDGRTSALTAGTHQLSGSGNRPCVPVRRRRQPAASSAPPPTSWAASP